MRIRIGPPAARSVIFFCLLLACAFLPVRVSAATPAPTWMDRRVTAIAQTRLLAKPGSQLVDPGRQRAAAELAGINRPLFFAWALLQVFAFLYLWRSGVAAAWRDRLRRAVRNEHVLRAVFGFILTFVAQLCALPVTFTRFRLAFAAGLTQQTAGSWFRDWVVGVSIDALFVAIFVVVVLALVDRTRLWYLIAIVLVFAATIGVMFIEPVVLAPLFNSYTPLHDDQLAARIHQLSERAGIGDPPIYIDNLSKQSNVGNAFVTGVGATKRIVLGDTLVDTATPDEVVYILGHELSHYVHRDVIKLTLVATGLFVVAMAIAVLIGDRIGFRRDDDPVSRLPLVGCILGCAVLVLLPVYNAYQRGIEARADRYGLELTHDPAAGVRAFVRFADDGLSPLCPPEAVRLYFYDHPPLGSRIAALQGKPDPCP
jgi:STE24 endopeptidase